MLSKETEDTSLSSEHLMTLNPQIKKEKNAGFDGKVKLNKEETLL